MRLYLSLRALFYTGSLGVGHGQMWSGCLSMFLRAERADSLVQVPLSFVWRALWCNKRRNIVWSKVPVIPEERQFGFCGVCMLLGEHISWRRIGEAEVVIHFYVLELPKVGEEERRPIVRRHHLSILCVYKLWHIAHNRGVYDSSHAVNFGTLEEALEEPKTPVWAELGVPYNQKRVSNVSVSSCHHSPHQVVDHHVVFVLSSTVVRVKKDVCLPQTVNIREVVQPTNHCVFPLPYLICKKVDLTRYCLTVYPKDRTLPRSKEVKWGLAASGLMESEPIEMV